MAIHLHLLEKGLEEIGKQGKVRFRIKRAVRAFGPAKGDVNVKPRYLPVARCGVGMAAFSFSSVHGSGIRLGFQDSQEGALGDGNRADHLHPLLPFPLLRTA